MNVFFSQPDQSVEQHIAFLLACAAAWKKHDIGDTSDWLKFKILRTKNVSQYLKCQPGFVSSTERLNATQIVQNIPSLQMLYQKLTFLLTFIPQSLKYTTKNLERIEIKLTKQLRQSREENDFYETDLSQWNKELTQLAKQLDRPSNIDLRQDQTILLSI